MGIPAVLGFLATLARAARRRAESRPQTPDADRLKVALEREEEIDELEEEEEEGG